MLGMPVTGTGRRGIDIYVRFMWKASLGRCPRGKRYIIELPRGHISGQLHAKIARANKRTILYTRQWQEAGITLDAVIDRMTSVKSNQWRTRDVAMRLAKYGNLKTPHKYDITIVRAFLNGTDGCDTPHGWKEYAKLVEAREKDEVAPKSEIANVRRCKTNLEGTTRRMHMMLDCDTNDVRFSDEQILSMFDDVSSLQKSIGLLPDTLNQLMRRSYASKSVAGSQSA